MPAEVDPNDLKIDVHAGLSHSGIPGVGDLSTGAHAALDHTGIPGVGLSTASGILLPKGYPHTNWNGNGDVSSNIDWLTSDSLFAAPDQAQVGGPNVPITGSDSGGPFIQLTGGYAGIDELYGSSNMAFPTSARPRLVGKFNFAYAGSLNSAGGLRYGFADVAGNPATAPTNALFFDVLYTPAGQSTTKIQRTVSSVSQPAVDTGLTLNSGPYYLVIDYTAADAATLTIYSTAFAVLYTTSISGGTVPSFTGLKVVHFEKAGDGVGSTVNLYQSQLSFAP
jgi:hypothetical protein